MRSIVQDKNNKSNPPLIYAVDENPDDFEFLASTSERDKKWDVQKTYNCGVTDIYANSKDPTMIKYGARTYFCAQRLLMGLVIDKETGEVKFKLDKADFCRVRTCPVCQWRRQCMWQARMWLGLDELIAAYPTARWLWLTLTWKNCKVENLRENIDGANKAFTKLTKRKFSKDIIGWIRTNEITCNKKNQTANPHIHVLLMVKSVYFKPEHYKTQKDWSEEWKSVNDFDYLPSVKLKVVKTRMGKIARNSADMAAAIKEVFKYSIKPADMVNNPEWFIEMTRQIHRSRAIGSGGVLKDMFKKERETNDDLLLKNPESEEEMANAAKVEFHYSEHFEKYVRRRK